MGECIPVHRGVEADTGWVFLGWGGWGGKGSLGLGLKEVSSPLLIMGLWLGD